MECQEVEHCSFVGTLLRHYHTAHCVSEERGDGEGGSLALVADVPVVCKALSY